MSKKQDAFYFESFIACADFACQAAHLLEKAMEEFSPEELPQKLDEIHAVEHAADEKKHVVLNTMVKAFITPIEREDIILLSQNIDEMTDKIEDVLIRIYHNNIRSIRPDALQLAKVVIRCCEAVKEMMGEFADFKRSKTLHDRVVNINTMEEEADQLYISSMHTLHTTCTDPIEIISWREIYMYLEKCADACEHVADVVESVVMKNS
ncbi:MAG TPA: DUF47 domain-containing protein [Candidatus Gallacutalibacter stercoravium]|nr:DUF47 domain-containing protein [Candidatus Gallacutalibacter stercoravium]